MEHENAFILFRRFFRERIKYDSKPRQQSKKNKTKKNTNKKKNFKKFLITESFLFTAQVFNSET
jgi:hypothetical protein